MRNLYRDHFYTVCVDVDDTILFTEGRDYENSIPNNCVINKLREAKAKGWYIIIYTARGQGRTNGNVWKDAHNIYNELFRFITKYDVPFDEIRIDKPWARWYVDDKAITPEQFWNLKLEED